MDSETTRGRHAPQSSAWLQRANVSVPVESMSSCGEAVALMGCSIDRDVDGANMIVGGTESLDGLRARMVRLTVEMMHWAGHHHVSAHDRTDHLGKTFQVLASDPTWDIASVAPCSAPDSPMCPHDDVYSAARWVQRHCNHHFRSTNPGTGALARGLAMAHLRSAGSGILVVRAVSLGDLVIVLDGCRLLVESRFVGLGADEIVAAARHWIVEDVETPERRS